MNDKYDQDETARIIGDLNDRIIGLEDSFTEIAAQWNSVPWEALAQVCAWADVYLAPEGAPELDRVTDWIAANRPQEPQP